MNLQKHADDFKRDLALFRFRDFGTNPSEADLEDAQCLMSHFAALVDDFAEAVFEDLKQCSHVSLVTVRLGTVLTDAWGEKDGFLQAFSDAAEAARENARLPVDSLEDWPRVSRVYRQAAE